MSGGNQQVKCYEEHFVEFERAVIPFFIENHDGHYQITTIFSDEKTSPKLVAWLGHENARGCHEIGGVLLEEDGPISDESTGKHCLSYDSAFIRILERTDEKRIERVGWMLSPVIVNEVLILLMEKW